MRQKPAIVEIKDVWSSYTSATGIVRLAKQELASSEAPSVLREEKELSAKAVLDGYKSGDALSVRVMDKVGEILGGALAMFTAVVDPETIVIGGGVSKAGQPLVDCIASHYKKYAFSACRETPIVIANLGNDAGIYGVSQNGTLKEMYLFISLYHKKYSHNFVAVFFDISLVVINDVVITTGVFVGTVIVA